MNDLSQNSSGLLNINITDRFMFAEQFCIINVLHLEKLFKTDNFTFNGKAKDSLGNDFFANRNKLEAQIKELLSFIKCNVDVVKNAEINELYLQLIL
jgi:hypothetical protein